MNSQERKAAISLAFIYSLRMLGLFMVLPVFSLYAAKLNMARPTLVGIALGIYGLTQAMFQIPFGMLSDKIGRKPVISLGLLIFMLGSFFAGVSHNIYGVIAGRALQGMGAVGSAISALLADLTREENRTKAMAIIGSMVGLAFMAAMVLGPIINGFITVSGIFILAGILGFIGILVLLILVPKPTKQVFHREAETLPALFSTVLKDKELLRLDLGVLISHAILTATFVALPISLQQTAMLSEHAQGMFYLPILLVAFLAMIPLIISAEKKQMMKLFLLLSIGALALAEFILGIFHTSLVMIAVGLTIFFTAFSFLEASLPSLISKRAPAASKGTAMGVYSTSQFFGMFLGGVCGGLLYAHHHLNIIYMVAAVLALLWLVCAITMEEPRYLGTLLVKLEHICNNIQAENCQAKIQEISGIAEVSVLQETQEDGAIAYLKYDKKYFSESELITKIREIAAKI